MFRILSILLMSSIFVVTGTSALAADISTLPGSHTADDGKSQVCVRKLRTFDLMLEAAGFGILAPESDGLSVPPGYYDPTGIPRMRIERLRDSAYYFSQRDDQANCEVMLIAMQEIYDQHQGLVGLEASDLRTVAFWRKVHIERAQPINKMDHLLRMDVFIGAEVRNLIDERLGVIRDVIVNPATQSIQYVLIANGGFMGFRQQSSMARWGDLFATADHELFVLNVSKATLSKAPRLDADNIAQLGNQQWQAQIDLFWVTVLKICPVK